jgi:hypothetical protein
MLRLFEAPEVEVHFVASGVRITGLGELSLPPDPLKMATSLAKSVVFAALPTRYGYGKHKECA